MDTGVLRESFSGEIIDGRFPLLEWIGADGSGEIFRTQIPGANPQPAAIRLIPAAEVDADAQLEIWGRTIALPHPHLLRLFDSGDSQIGGLEYLYVVMELPDEALAQILPDRPLTADEVRVMLPPLVDALAFLHAHSLMHGSLDPAAVLVVGEVIKLSTDALRPAGSEPARRRNRTAFDAPESATMPLSPAADVWSLGATIVAALTQAPPSGEKDSEEFRELPDVAEPFGEIARRCLATDQAKRGTLADVNALLHPSVAPADPGLAEPQAAPQPKPMQSQIAFQPEPIQPQPIQPEFIQPEPLLPELTQPEFAHDDRTLRPEPLQGEIIPPTQAEFAFDELQPSRRTFRSVEEEDFEPESIWRRPPVLIGAGVLLLLALFLLLGRSHKTQPAPPADTAQTTPAPTQSAQAPQPAAPRAASGIVKGSVAHRITPHIPSRTARTIHGRVNVTVRVSVDRNGNVTDAAVTSRDRNRYFDDKALEAAHRWRFKPAHINGHAALSVWQLDFEFTRSRTQITPSEVTP